MLSKYRLHYGTIAVLWMVFIFYLSSIPDLRSELPSFWDFILRKLAHFCEYAVLYFLWYKTLEGCKHRVLKAFFITVAYAATDELHQGVVHARVASPIDWGIDTLGALTAVLIIKPR